MYSKREKVLVEDILDIFHRDKNIVSATVVGSILDRSIEEVSDIDLIVIVNSLSKESIEDIKNNLLELTPIKYDLQKIFEINDSFGPLKKESEQKIIFHLMVYDIKDHIEHVNTSPFTCYDWERSTAYVKKSLSDIYSARLLMLQDFSTARRGLEDYLEDIKNERISYRIYEEKNNVLIQKKQYYKLDTKHKLEFSYHIIKNSVSNLLKILTNKNIVMNDEDFKKNWKMYFPNLYKKYFEIFIKLKNNKILKIYDDESYINSIPNFLEELNVEIENIYKESKKIFMIRHLKTDLNDGRFFGQKYDIPITPTNKKWKFVNDNVQDPLIFTSPLLRSLQTVEKFGYKKYTADNRLMELNYGLADGLEFDQFIEQNPEFKNKIKNNIDFKFPEGENYTQMYERVSEFVNEIKTSSIIFTHQGPIRAMIGKSLNIESSEWYKISVPHATPVEFISYKNNILLNIDRKFLNSMLKNI